MFTTVSKDLYLHHWGVSGRKLDIFSVFRRSFFEIFFIKKFQEKNQKKNRINEMIHFFISIELETFINHF